jgi:4-cresol dehydrogenase (hydroxylating)
VDGIFAQSNYGIVTKMGFWMVPEPEAYRSGQITVYGYEDLIPLVDTLNLVTNSGLTNGMNALGSPLLSARDPGDSELARLLNTTGGPDPAAMERYARANNVPYWSCKLDFYGPEEVIEAQWEYAQEKFKSEIHGADSEDNHPVYRIPLSDEQRVTLDAPGYPEKVSFGIPSLMRFGGIARSAWNPEPGTGHVFYSPVIPKNGEEIFKAQKVFNEAFIRMGVPRRGFASLPSLWYTRAAILLYGLPVRDDAEINAKTRETFRELVAIGHEHGWAEYRAPAPFMDEVMGAYDFNDSILLRLAEQLKDAIDPNGILAAGRGGIWPKHLRKV